MKQTLAPCLVCFTDLAHVLYLVWFGIVCCDVSVIRYRNFYPKKVAAIIRY